MTEGREVRLLACLLALFICRAIFASAIVPPWQGPDEPTHFALARLLAERQLDTAVLVKLPDESFATTIERDLQRGVLMSMARHRWWEAYGGQAPEPLPTSFRQIQRLGVGVYAQPLYYGVSAATLRITQPSSLEAEYLHLRVLGVVLSVVALSFGWAGTRLLFGPTVAVGATAIGALHPQFLLTAMSVNPDALLNVWGAFMWWQVARLTRGHRLAMSLVLLLIAAAAAVLTKRNGAPLVVVAAVAVGVTLCSHRTARVSRRTVFLALVVLGISGGVLAAGWQVFERPFTDLGLFWRNALGIRRSLAQATLSQALEYIRISIDYVWLIGGWLRYPAPEPWLWVVRVLTIAGLGSAAMLLRSPSLRQPLAIAWLFVIAQAAIVVGVSFLTLSSPQGRYLFPVIAPATALLWLGLTHTTPARFRPYAAPVLISILAVLDVTGFTTVLIPVYLPWG